MSDLYLIFFLVSAILFVLIVAYSVLTQRRKKSHEDEFDDLLPADDALLNSAHSGDAMSKPLQNTAVSMGSDRHQKDPLVEPKPAISERPAQANTVSNQESQPRPPEPSAKHANNAHSSAQTDENNQVVKPELESAVPPPSEAVQPKTKPAKKTFTQKIADKVTRKNQSVADEVVPSEVPSKEENEQPLERMDVTNEDGSSIVVTELVAKMKNPLPVEQQELLSVFRSHDFKFHRKVNIFGLNQLTDLWRDIEFELPSARFVELGVSIQLADRDGAMSEKELHDFQQMTLEFSNKFDAPFEFSVDIDDALKQAELLDQMGRRYDSMAVLNVVPKTKHGFRIADVESCARDLMMSSDKNGIFMKTEGRRHDLSVLYRLACTDGQGHFGLTSSATTTVHDLVVYMNVPATQAPEAVFEQMVKDANSLATWLEGKVVDRNGRAMTQRSYSVLMQQISGIVFSMQQDGLTPGDAVSKKLF